MQSLRHHSIRRKAAEEIDHLHRRVAGALDNVLRYRGRKFNSTPGLHWPLALRNMLTYRSSRLAPLSSGEESACGSTLEASRNYWTRVAPGQSDLLR